MIKQIDKMFEQNQAAPLLYKVIIAIFNIQDKLDKHFVQTRFNETEHLYQIDYEADPMQNMMMETQ